MLKNLIQFTKKNKLFIIIFLAFLLSRFYVLKFPPPHYSDVSHDYERYANMWWYGLPPYLKHYYEYPPATIPLLLFPLWLDLSGVGSYYTNYRVQIFVFEIFLFLIILKILKKIKTRPLSKYLAAIFYILIGMVAKDFWYEGLDLVFIGFYVIALAAWFLEKKYKLGSRILSWFFFWLSTAIKFMSGPLALPFLASQKEKLKKNLIAAFIGFLLVWGLPLAIFRSSLSVSLVFHLNRGAKYASFPSFIIEAVNQFTNSESRLDQPPDFQFVGPVSDLILKIFTPIFFLGVLGVVIFAFLKILKSSKKGKNLGRLLKYSLIYIFTIFLTGKVFSSPFHIWTVPLITIFPFKNVKNQLLVLAFVSYLVIVDTTPWIRLPDTALIGPLSLGTIFNASRFAVIGFLLAWFAKDRASENIRSRG